MESNKQDINSIKVLFFALLAGQLLFAAVVIFLLKDTESGPNYMLGPDLDLYAFGAYALAMIFLSRFIDGMWVKQIPTVKRVQRSETGHYRTNVIIRLAILEGAGLFSIVLTMVTINVYLFIVTAVLLAAFWFAQPTEEEFAERYA